MKKVREATEILRSLGLPRAQQNERSALTLLALADVAPRTAWKDARQVSLRVWDIMGSMREKYHKDYAANSRETIRRQTLHHFEQACIVNRNPDDPSRPTNSGKNCYSLTDEALAVVRAYGTRRFDVKVASFVKKFGTLQAAYGRRRKSASVSLVLPDGATVLLSPGKHNELQVAVIREMGPRFAPGAKVFYVGDTAKKHVLCDNEWLAKLRIPLTEHDKLPDLILFDDTRNWLFLVEAVTSHGPVSAKRHQEISHMVRNCPADCVYMTAFLTMADFRKYAADIAWESEVWVAEHPDHMIHFNGPKFLGPYPASSD